MISRARIILSLLAISIAVIPIQAHAESVPASFNFTGAGYGHGVGMSQIGAKARALAGESAAAILQYYFKDVSVVPVVDTATIRVNIGHALSSLYLAPSSGSLLSYYKGEVSITDTKTAPFFMSSKKQKVKLSADKKYVTGPVTSNVITVRWRDGVLPLISVTQGATTVKYKYGQMQIKVVKGALEVTNSLSLHDEYLLGISEVSSSWPSAVLEAQTIASRSYGLSKISKVTASCDCHVYAHTADQNFVGYSKEAEAKFGLLWRAAVLKTAIDSSTGLAILSNGKPIQAYFFSSSGGATQTSQDAWGGATSYTQSVSDTASVDSALNPRFASWNSSAEQNIVAQAFGLSDVVKLEIISRNSAGAVTWIKGTSQSGENKTLRGDTFRSRAKLPSPWFDLVGVQY